MANGSQVFRQSFSAQAHRYVKKTQYCKVLHYISPKQKKWHFDDNLGITKGQIGPESAATVEAI
jgi:hypothetical protein